MYRILPLEELVKEQVTKKLPENWLATRKAKGAPQGRRNKTPLGRFSKKPEAVPPGANKLLARAALSL
jgi:hypothetical protein